MTGFEKLIGQPQAIELLNQAVAKNKIANAYLFAGPNGVGRSIAARNFIELLFSSVSVERYQKSSPPNIETIRNKLNKGNHPDVLWVEPTYQHNGNLISAAEAASLGIKRKAPPQIRLEQIRDIAEFLGRQPLEAPRSLIVIERAETMAEAAANGLLKTLEEPGRATLILLAPSTESLLPTLVSRCQKIPFYRLTKEAIAQVLKQNGHDYILANQAVLDIAQGSPGEAIASWKQLESIPADILQEIQTPLKTQRQALELARQIEHNLDIESQLWLIDYLLHSYWRSQCQPSILQALEKARQYLLSYVQPRLVWEVTFLQMLMG